MSLAPPQNAIVMCPTCKNEFKVQMPWIQTKYSLDGGKIYSRNFFLALFEVPVLNDLYECTECETLCTPKDFLKKGFRNLDDFKDIANRKKLLKFSRAEMLEKLLKEKDYKHYSEKLLLILYWAGKTDTREALWLNIDHSNKSKQKEQKPINETYINKLLHMLNTKDEKNRLLKIEVLRSMGDFKDAQKLVDFDFKDKELLDVLSKEIENIDKKNTDSFLVKVLPQIIY